MQRAGSVKAQQFVYSCHASLPFTRPPSPDRIPRMKFPRWLPVVLILSGCAHLGATPGESWERRHMWDEAHGYFATDDYVRADSLFSLLAREFPETNEGRESLFYLGAMHLDPRNPEWDSEAAEKRLREYLAADGEEGLITGEFDYAELFRLLKAGGYQGDICCEVSGLIWGRADYEPRAAAPPRARTARPPRAGAA